MASLVLKMSVSLDGCVAPRTSRDRPAVCGLCVGYEADLLYAS